MLTRKGALQTAIAIMHRFERKPFAVHADRKKLTQLDIVVDDQHSIYVI